MELFPRMVFGLGRLSFKKSYKLHIAYLSWLFLLSFAAYLIFYIKNHQRSMSYQKNHKIQKYYIKSKKYLQKVIPTKNMSFIQVKGLKFSKESWRDKSWNI